MTAQIHERLILNGENVGMACSIGFPENHPRIVNLVADLEQKRSEYPRGLFGGSSKIAFEIEKRLNVDNSADTFFVCSTACWRRYIGTWEIKDGQLYLVKVVGKYRMLGEEPLFADWVNQVVTVPRGKMLSAGGGFSSKFEEDLCIKIEKGIVVESYVVDNRSKDTEK